MNLKTHTAYPEIQVSQTFDWTLEGRTGQVGNPNAVPIGAEVETVYPWVARILSQEGKTMGAGKGTAASREQAIADATAEIDAVADEYIRPAPAEGEIS
jgi:hypothetical protein